MPSSPRLNKKNKKVRPIIIARRRRYYPFWTLHRFTHPTGRHYTIIHSELLNTREQQEKRFLISVKLASCRVIIRRR